MRAFTTLFQELDGTTRTGAKLDALERYFRSAPAEDAAWALALLLGKRRRRLITGRRLREICLEGSDLPDWLFEACHSQVGDSAETVALMWAQRDPPTADAAALPEAPLHQWMEQRLPQLAALQGAEQAEAVRACWASCPPEQLLLVNKLLSGGFRVGVSTGLVTRGLARSAGLEEAVLAHRLMGGFEPSAAALEQLLAPGQQEEVLAARPYPFFLASPLDPAVLQQGDPSQWQLEWKWDGIRGQLIHRRAGCSLWSRGEELINDAFPELIALAASLPEGTVLDGEVIVWQPQAEAPEPFASLQRRLGRKAPSSTLQRQCPVCFIAYDLLEHVGVDLRPQPLEERRRRLEQLRALWLSEAPEALVPRWRLPEPEPLSHWDELEPLRQGARERRAEGLMLKQRNSPYLVGRKRGHWWKHKL
ncbi:MAG: ATP-dependent DNA ligase, partial [Cyanobacteria bacterium REEB498]|nr:ATP-dependent DNA ligase [Cyanobacteria bacterium REEB498]